MFATLYQAKRENRIEVVVPANSLEVDGRFTTTKPIDFAAALTSLPSPGTFVEMKCQSWDFFSRRLDLVLISVLDADGGLRAVMKVGRVAIITRGRFAGKKVRLTFSFSSFEHGKGV